VIDGTLIPIDHLAADRPFYSGKHHRHGMNLQVIAAPDGEIVWVSGPLPGAVHDLTAARIWGIIRHYHGSGSPAVPRLTLRRTPGAPHLPAGGRGRGPMISVPGWVCGSPQAWH